MTKFLGIVFCIVGCFCYGQIDTVRWRVNEKSKYSTLYDLANYIHNKSESEISKDTLLEKYIYFDNVLKDTVVQRKGVSGCILVGICGIGSINNKGGLLLVAVHVGFGDARL